MSFHLWHQHLHTNHISHLQLAPWLAEYHLRSSFFNDVCILYILDTLACVGPC